MGIPTLGCTCAVCTSATSPDGDPRNRRTRPSVLISWNGHNVIIDTGPDFHAQAIRAGIQRVDAVLYTHGHADHVLGMDDLAASFQKQPFHSAASNLPLYADDATADTIERIFGGHTFRTQNRYPTSARVTLNRLATTPGAEVALFGAHFQRIPVTHGRDTITGYRFGSAAYLTDLSDIPAESDSAPRQSRHTHPRRALRREPHPTHSTLGKLHPFSRAAQTTPRFLNAPTCRTTSTKRSHQRHPSTATSASPTTGLQLAFDIGQSEELRMNIELKPPQFVCHPQEKLSQVVCHSRRESALPFVLAFQLTTEN